MRLLILIILVFAGVLVQPRSASAYVHEQPITAEQLVREYGKLVVRITCVGPDGELRLGTGLIIDIGFEKNYSYVSVLTAAHVISDSTEVVIKTPFRMSFKEIKALNYAGNADAAVIRAVSYENPPLDHKSYGLSPTADSRKVPLGSRIFVIGNPQGLANTVSDGLLSGRRIDPTGSRLIQISAPISSGSSGGPVFDHYGRLIGVVTSSLEAGQNLNFAVPTEEIRHLRVAVDGLTSIGDDILISELGEDTARMKRAKAAAQSPGKKRIVRTNGRGRPTTRK